MKKKLLLIYLVILLVPFVMLSAQDGQVPKDLLSDKIWMDGHTRNIFGYPITKVFGNDNISNDRFHGNRFSSEIQGGMLSVTNVGYLEFDDVLKDLQKAWNKHEISLPVQQYLEDSLRNVSGGGFIYVYIERPTQDAANLRYFFTVVRDQTDKKKFFEFNFPRETPKLVAGKGNWWNYYVIPMETIPKYPFYIYVNDRQSDDLSDFKFRIDSKASWQLVEKDVKLVSDLTFALNNDWKNIFKTKTNSENCSLLVTPDSSIVVSCNDLENYLLFDKNGNFLKEFGIKKEGSSTKKVANIKGIINDNMFFTEADKNGKITFFDFSGIFIQSLLLDYSVYDIVAMDKDKIAVVGSKTENGISKKFISMIDINSKVEKTVWKQIENLGDKLDKFQFPKLSSINNQLIASFPAIGGIIVFDHTGKLIRSEKMSWIAYNLDEEIKNTESPKFASNIKITDNQLLFFDFPDKEGKTYFHVWALENSGRFLGKYAFKSNEINISYPTSTVCFFNGFLYVLQDFETEEGTITKLLKFHVEGL